ncbi:MAG: hypothetical protein AAFZ15_34320 [Bacteroidota bacterium]
MSKYNINSVLILIGFLLLLIGFFIDQKGTVDFQMHDTYLVVAKSQVIRTVGLLTVLNGLVYALFDKIGFYFNRRFKYFGIVLFFLSFFIILNGLMFFSDSNGLGNSLLFSLNSKSSSLGFLIVTAGFVTLMFSLLMPLVIWIQVSLSNVFSK